MRGSCFGRLGVLNDLLVLQEVKAGQPRHERLSRVERARRRGRERSGGRTFALAMSSYSFWSHVFCGCREVRQLWLERESKTEAGEARIEEEGGERRTRKPVSFCRWAERQ